MRNPEDAMVYHIMIDRDTRRRNTKGYADAIRLVTEQIGNQFEHRFADSKATEDPSPQKGRVGIIILRTRIEFDAEPLRKAGFIVRKIRT